MVCPDQWDAQATVKRVNESLIERGYMTWFDLTNMKGNTKSIDIRLSASVMSLLVTAADRP
jgi:hypothetical protein